MMRIDIQTVDGQFFQSDEFDMANSDLSPNEFDEQVNELATNFEDWPTMGHIGFEYNGRKRYFNPANVLWAEIVFL